MKKALSIMLMLSMLLGIFCVLPFGAAAATIPTSPMEAGNAYPINKTATPLENDYTTVTLSVPAEEVALGVDIIYIVGSYATKSDGSPNIEGDVLISSLVDTMTEIVASGVPVNFGMVPFSSDPVVAMKLTTITEGNLALLPQMIANALATCEALYDGVNMENALIKAKKMFSESPLAGHPERQHLVMISSGFTYFFNSGANNEFISTVPVNYTGVNRLFFWNKAWQRARTNQTNTYPIPKAIVEAYNAKNDKAEDESLWDFYWSYIDEWSKKDIAAGDKVVYEACTVESEDFLAWYNSGELVSGYSQTGYGKAIPNTTAEDIANAVTLKAGANPLTDEAAAHAIGYERAMWEAYEYAKANIIGAGINFYPIYNALNVNYTNGNWSPSSYKITWTNQYIGHSFVDMLAGGEGKAVKYETQGDKTFFAPIKKAILYTISAGSKVTDAIGYDAENGNFEFITEENTITLTVNGNAYNTVMTSETTDAGKIIEASYDFTNPQTGEREFSLDYYYGDGKEGEYFDWNFYTDISMSNRVSLTYQLQLTDKATETGTYTVATNRFAVLYPVDSEGDDGIPQLFPVPEVDYEVVIRDFSATIKGKKVFDRELKNGMFEFVLKEGGEVIATAHNDEKGDFSFTLKLDKPGVYEYTVEEIDNGDEDIVFDHSVYNVTVTANKDGTTKVEYDRDIIFENATFGIAHATINGYKYLDGELADGFTFVLEDDMGNIVDIATSEGGEFEFNLELDEAYTHVYYVYELNENEEGIVYDDSVFEVRIDVERAETAYTATVRLMGVSEIAFYNETIPEETTEAPEETTEIPEETTEAPEETTEAPEETTEAPEETTEAPEETTEAPEETTEAPEETTEAPEVTTEPEEEITEEPTPLDPTPETTEPEEEITDPEIPLDPNPKTGDASIILVIVAVASIALAALYIKRRQVIED